MSESAKTIIKYFCDRFLEIDYYPTNLKTILNLHLDDLKNISTDELEQFQKLNINSLRDLCNLDKKQIEKILKKGLIDKSTLYNSLIAATLIQNAWNKRKLYRKKPKMKVVVAGLDFAGKTSLINRLINDYNYKDMINLNPTKGANIEEFQSDRIDLILWDLGGQKDNIDEYLESPEKFFIQIDVLIFVIDSQDNVRYNQAIKYLEDLIEILEFLNENPHFLILLNKADHDIIEDPDFQIQIEYLTEKISEKFKISEKSKSFEITPTSIYNFYSNEPEITKSIKDIFSKQRNQINQNFQLPELETKLQDIMDINLKLMDKMVSELSEIKILVQKFTPPAAKQSHNSNITENSHSDYKIVSGKSIEINKKRKKKERIEKQKKIKKHRKSSGPPKRLPNQTRVDLNQKSSDQDEKLSGEDLKAIRRSLKTISYESSPVSTQTPDKKTTYQNHPPIAPPTNIMKNKLGTSALKPPPPPSQTFTKTNRGSNRLEIINELKDMFKKRRLVMG